MNDVTGGRGDEEMMPLIAETNSAFIILHMQGTPQTMQITPQYTNVVSEIADFFRQQYARAIVYNIDPMAIAFDPGIGFGKTLEHNLELLAQLERLRACDRPIVIGISRKSFLGKLINSAQMSDRLAPAVALTSLFARNCSITGITRRNSSSVVIASDPGRVDSPPTSTMCAPSAAIFKPCSTALSTAKNFPASENESGVTFNTPMISPFRERSKMRPPIFQSLPRIMDETTTGRRLFERRWT